MTIGFDGLPTIDYEDNSRRARDGVTVLKAAHCRDVACGTFTVAVLDTVRANAHGSRRLVTATSSVTGLAYVAYLEGHNGAGAGAALKLATCLDPACTNRSTNTVDRNRSGLQPPGTGMSMAVGRDALPLPSYTTHFGFFTAHCVNVFRTGSRAEEFPPAPLVGTVSAPTVCPSSPS